MSDTFHLAIGTPLYIDSDPRGARVEAFGWDWLVMRLTSGRVETATFRDQKALSVYIDDHREPWHE